LPVHCLDEARKPTFRADSRTDVRSRFRTAYSDRASDRASDRDAERPFTMKNKEYLKPNQPTTRFSTP